MALLPSQSPMDSEHTSPPHLLTLPFELREQILYQALLGEIMDRGPYPFGTRTLLFDRPVLAIFSNVELEYMERTYWKSPAFWGKEPMTRLMRVNKQLYEEVYSILWREFSVHLAPMKPKEHDEWFAWLREHNPRAIGEIQHLHIRLPRIVEYGNRLVYETYKHERLQKEYLEKLEKITGSYPALRSITLQLCLINNRREIPSDMARERCVKQYLELICACQNGKDGGKVDVKVLYEGNPETWWRREIGRACQEGTGQQKTTTALLEWHMERFPWEVSREDW